MKSLPTFLLRPRPGLEGELQRDLQLARITEGVGYLAERRRPHQRVRPAKMRMIEGVERFRAELQDHPFANRAQWKILEQRNGDIAGPRLPHRRECPRSAADREILGDRQRALVVALQREVGV